jgi:hypothetical protein
LHQPLGPVAQEPNVTEGVCAEVADQILGGGRHSGGGIQGAGVDMVEALSLQSGGQPAVAARIIIGPLGEVAAGSVGQVQRLGDLLPDDLGVRPASHRTEDRAE